MFNHIFESNHKRKIVVELDERYFDKKVLCML